MLSTGNYLRAAHVLCAKMELLVAAKKPEGTETQSLSARHEIIRFAMLPAQML